MYEERFRVLSIKLENTSNVLKHSERVNAEAEIEKKELQTKIDNHLDTTEKWKNGSKNLFKLIDSSMFLRTKASLGYDNQMGENESVYNPKFSVFTTTLQDVEGKHIYNRFDKSDGMKAVPPPLSGNYIPLSDPTDFEESQMTYGKKHTNSIHYIFVSNDSISCAYNDKSLELKINDFASCDSVSSPQCPCQKIQSSLHYFLVFPHLRVKLIMSQWK